jgi:hypothetical protein
MKKITIEKLQSLDARCVGISALQKPQRHVKFITLGEVAYEAAVLLSASVPITIEDQIPVFTEWVENALKGNTELQKNNYLNKQWD